MRPYYELEDVCYAEVETSIIPSRATIVSIYVEEEYQGLGMGRALLNVICHDADLQGIQLWLVAQPLGSGLPARSRLEAFYRKAGFESKGGYMIREPSRPIKDRTEENPLWEPGEISDAQVEAEAVDLYRKEQSIRVEDGEQSGFLPWQDITRGVRDSYRQRAARAMRARHHY